MRISTRFGLGAALAVLPLVGVMVYSVERMQSLAHSNERITTRQLVGIRLGAGVIRRIERLEEYQRKFIVSEDHGYALKFAQTLEATSAELASLRTSGLSPEEVQASRRLHVAWSRFVDHSGAILRATSEALVAEELGTLLDLALGVQEATRRAAELEAETASAVRQEITRTALTVTGVALLLSFTLILLTVRSLRARIEHFVQGTVAVSRGAFSFRLRTHDDELGEVARAFNRMVDALGQLDRMKADFVSSVSHELKTPIVAMLETNELLLDGVSGPLTPRQERMLRLNTQAAQRLSKMICDLLELSRLKAELRYQMSARDIRPLTETAVGELEALALERGVTIETSCDASSIVVLCDPDRYVQIVQNLLGNALEHTPPGGTIVVDVRRSASSVERVSTVSSVADHAVLRVDDSGPGIPKEDRERVFEKFFRRQGQPAAGRVGLGLAICREIVEAHGGAIRVGRSALGGASMRVVLPLEPAPSVNRGASW